MNLYSNDHKIVKLQLPEVIENDGIISNVFENCLVQKFHPLISSPLITRRTRDYNFTSSLRSKRASFKLSNIEKYTPTSYISNEPRESKKFNLSDSRESSSLYSIGVKSSLIKKFTNSFFSPKSSIDLPKRNSKESKDYNSLSDFSLSAIRMRNREVLGSEILASNKRLKNLFANSRQSIKKTSVKMDFENQPNSSSGDMEHAGFTKKSLIIIEDEKYLSSAQPVEEQRTKPTHIRLQDSDVRLAIKAIQQKRIEKKHSRETDKVANNDPLCQRLQRRISETQYPIKNGFTFGHHLSKSCQKDIMDINSKYKKNIHLYEIQSNRATLKNVINLRYRENIYKAASKLTKEMPPYPDWNYQDENIQYLDILTINVGGRIFQIFEDVLSALTHTKLASCLIDHKNVGVPFFDRDYVCFSAVLNFYRTGRLHVPPNTCLTFFEEELEFWGVSEQFIEPCCWSEFESFKVATNTLKKYAEDQDKDENFKDLDEKTCLNLRMKLYRIMTTGTGSVLARWVATICAVFIVLSISLMLVATTAFGRIDINNSKRTARGSFEKVSHFLTRTKVHPLMEYIELTLSGFFLSELIFRLILCPNRLEFFSDTLNWIDLTATTTSLLSNIFTISESSGHFEGYMLLLKLPRIFRLFKLTASLRSGMEAFTLTIRACANELKLVFFLLFIATSIFGTLIFVVEMVNEHSANTNKGAIANIYLGMWLAFVSMTSVGFGDFVPQTNVGFLCASFIIMCGIIICQLPVPIVLKNFGIYNSQASARLNHKFAVTVRCTDPESMANADENESTLKKQSVEKYNRMISQYKR